MFGRATKKLTRMVATVCVAITCLFCVQSTLITVDRVEHALELEHEASPLAGTVQSCPAVPDACGQPSVDDHPISHAHLGDAATTVLPASHPALAIIEFAAAAFSPVSTEAARGTGQPAPDRPPKA